jgi:hypothetical protein
MGYEMSEQKHTRRAVLVSVERDGAHMRISLDDVVCDAAAPMNWERKEHVTNKSVAHDAFEKMEFDEKELADFGNYILARLSAFVKRKEN